ncbi:Acireductone dioxygenase 3 [Castilleja foliolosa]|uniref:Acireductone dioxygenase 3 n=1 Tax=Castilleja foliolosa TaxID=1961234 RepID=A0ABD3BN21_9LAMI
MGEAWICVWVKKVALIALPTGIYHRLTLDSNNYRINLLK